VAKRKIIVQVAPVAHMLFVVSGFAEVSVEKIVSEIWPFLFLSFGLVILIAIFPDIALWIPRLAGFTG
jgi:TRAP-type C4-dicarboxylate transport system permease large subunit